MKLVIVPKGACEDNDIFLFLMNNLFHTGIAQVVDQVID